MRKRKPIFLGGIIYVAIVIAQPLFGATTQSKAEVQNIAFCNLLNKPDAYDGKEVRFQAKYISTFEVSAFVQDDCANNQKHTWVEFDDTSISRSTKPEVLRKVEEQVYCCLLSGSSIRETELVVTAIFHKPRESQGYGHGNDYCFMVTVKSVQEIGPTVTVKVPGFEGI